MNTAKILRPETHITVATVIEKNGQYLLVEELIDGTRVFNQPAGHWEPGETLEDAAVRETLEETAWDVTISGLLGVFLLNTRNNGCYCRFAFSAEPISERTNLALDAGILGAVWLDRDQIEADRDKMRSPLVMECIEAFESGQLVDPQTVLHAPINLP